MPRYGIRVAIAILTFLIGIAVFWPLKLIKHLETALVDRFYNVVSDHDLRPISLTFDSATDANEIYRLLIQDFRSDPKVKLIVLHAETESFTFWTSPQREEPHKMVADAVPEAELQTIDNYLLRNETPEQLKVWNLGIDYVLVTKTDLPAADAQDFWATFYEKFPYSPGLISFSNVGFNEQHDQALVYMSRGCGGLCGAGGYVLLKKIAGKWEIQAEENLWVS